MQKPTTMKTQFKLLAVAAVATCPLAVICQDSYEEMINPHELRILKLEEKLKKAEAKVLKYQRKVEVADSLMNTGKQLEAEARNQLTNLLKEDRQFIKMQNKELLNLHKQTKDADKDLLKELENARIKLDRDYVSWCIELDQQRTKFNKTINRANYTQQRGKYKNKQYSSAKKTAQKGMKIAKKNLEKYKASYGM